MPSFKIQSSELHALPPNLKSPTAGSAALLPDGRLVVAFNFYQTGADGLEDHVGVYQTSDQGKTWAPVPMRLSWRALMQFHLRYLFRLIPWPPTFMEDLVLVDGRLVMRFVEEASEYTRPSWTGSWEATLDTERMVWDIECMERTLVRDRP